MVDEVFFSGGKVERDGDLIWKTILAPGRLELTPGPGGKRIPKPLIIVEGHSEDPTQAIGLADLYDSFEERAFQNVTVPETHKNGVLENKGFIRKVRWKEENGKQVLQGAFDFTNAEVLGLVEEGSVADVSCGIVRNYQRQRDGKRFPAVIEHVALTNQPWVDGMTPFTALFEEETDGYYFSEQEDRVDLAFGFRNRDNHAIVEKAWIKRHENFAPKFAALHQEAANAALHSGNISEAARHDAAHQELMLRPAINSDNYKEHSPASLTKLTKMHENMYKEGPDEDEAARTGGLSTHHKLAIYHKAMQTTDASKDEGAPGTAKRELAHSQFTKGTGAELFPDSERDYTDDDTPERRAKIEKASEDYYKTKASEPPVGDEVKSASSKRKSAAQIQSIKDSYSGKPKAAPKAAKDDTSKTLADTGLSLDDFKEGHAHYMAQKEAKATAQAAGQAAHDAVLVKAHTRRKSAKTALSDALTAREKLELAQARRRGDDFLDLAVSHEVKGSKNDNMFDYSSKGMIDITNEGNNQRVTWDDKASMVTRQHELEDLLDQEYPDCMLVDYTTNKALLNDDNGQHWIAGYKVNQDGDVEFYPRDEWQTFTPDTQDDD